MHNIKEVVFFEQICKLSALFSEAGVMKITIYLYVCRRFWKYLPIATWGEAPSVAVHVSHVTYAGMSAREVL